MRTVMLSVVGVLVAASCSREYRVQGAPPSELRRGRTAAPPVPKDQALALPAPGTTRGDVLADGWPVWVVHHAEGDVSVISAVRREDPDARWPGEVPRNRPMTRSSLVSWIAGTRRFRAGSVVYDERGAVVGHAAFDVCLDGCPKITSRPSELLDLDAYEARVDAEAGTVSVSVLRPGSPRRVAADWVDWRREDGREEDFAALARPPVPPLDVSRALAMPDGAFAIVDADVVTSTEHAPQLCKPPLAQGGCLPCGPDAVPVRRVAAEPARVRGRGSEQGIWLVQRTGASVEIVARGAVRGSCGTALD